ncbi:MAG: zinc-binding dehydrogenase [Gemmatimonadota bacterium]|nr:zinc-binding dehydrogenase [Gemmatimonadota bacterium]MDE2870393.1 zinc-binding dehydrogenase [Gemmatimonadota bacterium]
MPRVAVARSDSLYFFGTPFRRRASQGRSIPNLTEKGRFPKVLAAVFHKNGGPEVVKVEDVPVPRPGVAQFRIRVEASSMNHLDLWMRRGLPIEIPMPHIGGSDIAGTVDEAGGGADRTRIGRRVVVDPSIMYDWYRLARIPGLDVEPFQVIGEHTQGGFAEFAVVPAANVVELPDGFPAATAAAAALAGVTAWRGLMSRGCLREGERVLITGASGGVSSMAVQFADAAGAEVFAVTSSEDNVRRVRALGAHHVFDRTTTDWGREIHRMTGRRGVDLCLDSVGEAIWPQLLRALAVGGRLVSFGATTGPAGKIDIRLLFWRQLSILGSTMGTRAEFREAMDMVFRGVVTPPVHAVLPLSEARRAHELLEAGNVFGKLVLAPGSEPA